MHDLPKHGELWVQDTWPHQQVGIIDGLPDHGDRRTFGYNEKPDLPGSFVINTSGGVFTQEELFAFLMDHSFKNQGPFRELVLMKGSN